MWLLAIVLAALLNFLMSSQNVSLRSLLRSFVMDHSQGKPESNKQRKKQQQQQNQPNKK